jgi:AraC-like DNA-binding protein
VLGDAAASNALAAADMIGLLAIASAFALALLSVTPDGALITLVARATHNGARAARAMSGQDAGASSPSAVEAEQLAALNHLMQVERVYRHEGLSIANLAGKLNVPEYRLRRLINQRLGYRNFNAFLNDHRLADAMVALTDPGQAEVPILTIALDAGFQSIGPFNRAFKDRTGMTPTDFRRRELVKPRAAGSQALAAE